MTNAYSIDTSVSKQSKNYRLTNDVFIKRAIALHGDRFCYEDTIYKNSRTKVVVKCKAHGDILISPLTHLQSYGCPSCAFDNNPKRFTTAKFIEIARAKHGDRFCYDLVEYKNKSTKVLIGCELHGLFLQAPEVHTRDNSVGCPHCNGNAKLDTLSFINKANIKHSYRYDYSETVYTKASEAVLIRCKQHGLFSQAAHSHLEGYGCIECADFGGFTRKDFKRVCSKNNNGLGVLYVIKCNEHGEVFFKVGITSYDIAHRFRYGMPYHYDVVFEIVADSGYVYDIEQSIHQLLSAYNYRPTISFDGQTECFTTIKPVEKLLKKLSSTEQLQLLA